MKLQGADVLGAGWRAKGGKIQQPFFFSPFLLFLTQMENPLQLREYSSHRARG